ncbi:response regulator transcription factor [Neobacillus kokaensis]|uniref:DNA-binding response regulator n=1 Tax=Neobacillus kokaensis TaxID=2759023 RepID=A0ABQ3NAY6_9BACI|nr:response regulator [Neobacillus kokaensis]GHI01071.1 DNA-binding response regulator [Neobacillus kokaensis]
MYNVLLVDDEQFIRERIKGCLNWDELGFSIIGEAENGEKALHFIRNNPIDLAIIDINMPLMDGLELAGLLHEQQKGLQIVFLTGYDKFEYAQKAIQLGVFDYILKPVRSEDLAEMLQKFKEKKEKENAASVALDQKEMKSYIVYQLLNGPVTNMMVQAYQELFSAVAGEPACFLLISPDVEVEENLQTQIVNFVLQSFPRPIYHLGVNHQLFSSYLIRANDIDRAQSMLFALKKHFQLSFSIGAGPRMDNLLMFGEAFQKAKFALHNRLTKGTGKIYHYLQEKDESHSAILEKIEKLSVLVKSGNEEMAQKELAEIIHLCQQNKLSSAKFFLLTRELITSINKGIHDFQLKKDYFTELNQFDRFTEQFRTIKELKTFFSNLLIEAISISRQTLLELKSLSLQAITFMESQYQDCEIGLNSIAEYLHVNPSYLSRIFKKETGITVIEYLTKIRMENARKLLMNGCKNIQFVSEMTGYNDPHYFSRCFKKYYKVPPSKII